MAVARWALAADVAAGLTGTLLLLAQVTLLAAVIVARAGLAQRVRDDPQAVKALEGTPAGAAGNRQTPR